MMYQKLLRPGCVSRKVAGSIFTSLAAILLLSGCASRCTDCACSSSPAESTYFHSEFIYETAPFPSCHASTIEETKNGLIAAWFGGTKERDPDVGIWVARHENGKWTTPVEVANGVGYAKDRLPCWNPVLFQPKSGPLMLFYKVGPTPRNWWGMLMTSEDQGVTWSKPRRLPDGILGPIKNKPVQLVNGDILSPTSTEHAGWRVHFERSSDLGKTWTVATPGTGEGKPVEAIQPSILFHGGKKLQSLGRTQGGKLFETWSQDGGNTWGAVTLMDLPNPSSGTDAVTLKDGRQLLICNPVAKGRSPLILAESRDGKKWRAVMILEDEPGKEFSYPAIIQTKDGMVHMTYTWKRQRIKHAVVDPKKLSPINFANGEWPQP